VLFDQDGQEHRQARRSAASLLGTAGLGQLRPVWLQVLADELKPLARNETVDVVHLAAAMAGATVAEMFGTTADPIQLAKVAQAVAAAAAREHVPGLRRRAASGEAAAQLAALLPSAGNSAPMLAVAAISTTIAGLPRAVAWCADGRLWAHADEPALVDELLRTVAPSPLLPRVASGSGTAGSEPVRKGDRLLLVARHAVLAQNRDPDFAAPAPAQMSQLVFGAGPHACPGAAMARWQLADVLQALAPFQPAVVKARADRRSALPGWRTLLIRAR
jgi:cytochrome P450